RAILVPKLRCLGTRLEARALAVNSPNLQQSTHRRHSYFYMTLHYITQRHTSLIPPNYLIEKKQTSRSIIRPSKLARYRYLNLPLD
ncbi:hypothetical protein TWF225_011426, partial [Orbilia oligospora]